MPKLGRILPKRRSRRPTPRNLRALTASLRNIFLQNRARETEQGRFLFNPNFGDRRQPTHKTSKSLIFAGNVLYWPNYSPNPVSPLRPLWVPVKHRTGAWQFRAQAVSQKTRKKSTSKLSKKAAAASRSASKSRARDTRSAGKAATAPKSSKKRSAMPPKTAKTAAKATASKATASKTAAKT